MENFITITNNDLGSKRRWHIKYLTQRCLKFQSKVAGLIMAKSDEDDCLLFTVVQVP